MFILAAVTLLLFWYSQAMSANVLVIKLSLWFVNTKTVVKLIQQVEAYTEVKVYLCESGPLLK